MHIASNNGSLYIYTFPKNVGLRKGAMSKWEIMKLNILGNIVHNSWVIKYKFSSKQFVDDNLYSGKVPVNHLNRV